jgi:hypothetical protein
LEKVEVTRKSHAVEQRPCTSDDRDGPNHLESPYLMIEQLPLWKQHFVVQIWTVPSLIYLLLADGQENQPSTRDSCRPKADTVAAVWIAGA